MSKWFANIHESKRYELPADIGGWVELRKELSVGERRRAFANSIKGQTDLGNGQTRTDYDHAKLSFGLVIAYLADWSEKTEITADAVEALDPVVYDAIEEIVDAHADEFAKRPRERQTMKSRAKKTSDAAISSSVAPSAGH